MTNNGGVTELQHQEAQRRVSKAELLQPAIVTEEVPIEALEGSVVLRSFTLAQRNKINTECGVNTDKFDEEKYQLLTISEALVEPQITFEEAQALKEQDGRIIDELVVAITMLNMVGRATNLKKGSKTTPSFASLLNSQSD